MRQEIELKHVGGHFFMVVDNQEWLIDTGCPISFGNAQKIVICERSFQIANNYGYITIAAFAQHINNHFVGLIGTDILNAFDVTFNIREHKVVFDTDDTTLQGAHVNIVDFLDNNKPILEVTVNYQPIRMFFDTGAQLSYYQGNDFNNFPDAGDFKHSSKILRA